MRCPWCATFEDKVVDSREVDGGAAVRRRRECARCGRRFTTYERVADTPLSVVKRSGQRVPFDRAKVAAGVRAACKNRPADDAEISALAARVEQVMWEEGPVVTSEQIGRCVLDRLRLLDDVAAVRFASVYKGFDDVQDFARELGLEPPPPSSREPG